MQNIISPPGAWIVTGGMNAGVMKHVGEAVRDYTLKHGSKNIITTIGVACWGCVLNRENLVSKTGCWPANYTSVASSNLSGRDCPLDPNHTHFILADDGTSGMYGMEIGLRSELERAISNSPTVERGMFDMFYLQLMFDMFCLQLMFDMFCLN